MKTYLVELADRADMDVDNIYLGYHWRTMEQAERWRAGFASSLASLSSMPNRCPIARDNVHYPGVTVRQLVFGKYRILFHVVEPGEEETQGYVRVMRVLHGAQMLESEDKDDV